MMNERRHETTVGNKGAAIDGLLVEDGILVEEMSLEWIEHMEMERELRRRGSGGGDDLFGGGESTTGTSSTKTAATTAEAKAASTTVAVKTTAQASDSATSSVAAATATATSDLPKPFDSSIGANFTTTSCPIFINAFLANSTFQSCLPFSLLLQVRASPTPYLLLDVPASLFPCLHSFFSIASQSHVAN